MATAERIPTSIQAAKKISKLALSVKSFAIEID